MSTSRSDLAKAKLLLLIYSGKVFKDDGIWVICENSKESLYKKHLMEDLVKEGHVEYDGTFYKIPEHLNYLKDDWILNNL